MTACTICAAPTPGDDDANEAWCTDCFARHICQTKEREARRLATDVELRLTADVECRLAVSRVGQRLVQTLGRN